MNLLTKHDETRDSNGDVKDELGSRSTCNYGTRSAVTDRKNIGVVDGFGISLWMSHVSINVGKNAVTAPRCFEILACPDSDKELRTTHEQAKAYWYSRPSLRE